MRTGPWLWLAAWLVFMAVLVASLWLARRRVVERRSTPEAITQWRAWQDETDRLSQSSGPVRRRAATGDEPPALVLLRDHFGAIVATSVLIGSFLFGFLAFVGRGIARQRVRRTSGDRGQLSGGHQP